MQQPKTIDLLTDAKTILQQEITIQWKIFFLAPYVHTRGTVGPSDSEEGYTHILTVEYDQYGGRKDRRVVDFVRAIEKSTFIPHASEVDLRVKVSFKTITGKNVFALYTNSSYTQGYFKGKYFELNGPFSAWLKDKIDRISGW